ncbi:MAG TPA: DUF58 domain-containing protein [Microbacterium sp.]|nr:DUF58 domain-containing protein [Microbacterium sp.]
MRSPALLAAAGGAIALAGVGLIVSRPDVVALALPLALWALIARRPARDESVEPVRIRALPDEAEGVLSDEILVDAPGEMAEIEIVQSARRIRRAIVPGSARLTAHTAVLHSGPVESSRVTGRALDRDAALIGDEWRSVVQRRSVAPAQRALPEIPLAPRLTGLHGAHDGSRPGQGGDFRDIHPFAPGDELRRVDWRATARAARRPGEMLVRRTDSLSDASVVIAVDTADDLGEVVSTWGDDDLERSGTTSLDHAREAARSLAAAATAMGDRVAYHVLVQGGRSVRGGTGSRHLARLVAAIADTGQAGDDARYRRTPPVPHGSVIAVLSTFFDGAAAELALMWRAAGHRVIAVDTLPDLDRARLSERQELALKIVLAERDEVFRDLTAAGVERVRWDANAALSLGVVARARVGGAR